MKRNITIQEGKAFDFLKSLTPPGQKDRSDVITDSSAQSFTSEFRSRTTPFTIPISWTMTKDALVNLLGITSYTHYSEVTGVRFYASVNGDDQLTLIAVSTTDGTGCHDDLTEEDDYPYYDYADPCPNNCSNIGSLKANLAEQVADYFVRTTSGS